MFSAFVFGNLRRETHLLFLWLQAGQQNCKKPDLNTQYCWWVSSAKQQQLQTSPCTWSTAVGPSVLCQAT